MTQDAGLRVPVIDADRCVHGLSAVARCNRCASACPKGALQLGDTALSLDEDACTGCGHCRAACSEDAISFSIAAFAQLIDTQKSEALIACNKAVTAVGRGVVPCLHGVSEADLRKLGNDGIGTVQVAHAVCRTCEHKASVTINERLAAVNRVRTSHRQAPIALHEISAEAWVRRAKVAGGQGRLLDEGRRALFAGFLRRDVKPSAIAVQPGEVVLRYVPSINAASCVACDACARICPHHAIQVSRDVAGLHYALDADRCSGCGLCVDVCADHAVSVAEFSPAVSRRIDLVEAKCKRCGAPFHESVREHAGADGAEGRVHETYCRICRSKSDAQKLFEVRT